MLSIPRVVINGFTFAFVITIPLTAPSIVPKAIPRRTPARGETPSYIIRAANIPLTAIREPTERSIPPVIITIVTPIAIMPMVDILRITLNRLPVLRK